VVDYYLHDDPRLPAAAAPWYTHEYITYFAVLTQDWLLNLPTVEVQANPQFGDWPVGPNHVDLYKEGAEVVRDIPLEDAQDCADRNGDFSPELPVGAKIEPWKILVLYPTEPDMELDTDLNLHPGQKVTQGSHGWRHMEFRVFGKKFGALRESFWYYFNAAKRAWVAGNAYWAWRFLSRATHYLADLGHPAHVKVFPYRMLFRILRHLKESFTVFSAAHNGHEVYAQARFRQGFMPFKEALVDGARLGSPHHGNFRYELERYCLNAKKQLTPIYTTLLHDFGDEFVHAYDKFDPAKEFGQDASQAVLSAEKEAHDILFRDPNNPGLQVLDRITTDLLREVGRMLGFLFATVKTEFV